MILPTQDPTRLGDLMDMRAYKGLGFALHLILIDLMQPSSAGVESRLVQTLSASFMHVLAAFLAEPELVHMPLYKAG